MKRLILIALVLAAAAGCSNTPNSLTVSEAREEAQKRWYHTRAQMLYGVATEYFKAGQLDRSFSKCQEALALDSKYSEARILLGKVYIEQGNSPAAIVELEKVCSELPKSDEAAYLLGVAQEQDNQLDAAVVSYRKSLALQSNNLPAVKAVTEVLVRLGKTQEARSYLEGYIGQAGNDPAMYELAGRLAVVQKDYAQGVSHFQQAHDLDPANVRYRESLGDAQFQAGSYGDAADTFGDLVKQPGYKASDSVYTRLGDCLLAADKARDARGAYTKASEMNPKNAQAWIGLAQSALKLGDATRAALSARAAVDADPTSLDAAMVLGYALLRDGKTQESITVLAQGAKDHPGNATIQCVLGRAYWAAGQADKARECYAQALRLEPENQLARELSLIPSAVNSRTN